VKCLLFLYTPHFTGTSGLPWKAEPTGPGARSLVASAVCSTWCVDSCPRQVRGGAGGGGGCEGRVGRNAAAL
jgi:hypothetical protein